MPLFSLITPIYKVEKYLSNCISSMINQTYKDIEIILVDDGSPDNCLQICEDFKSRDGRIVVLHKNNGGLVSARQAGIQVANGRYVICIDGDDWIEADYCEVMANIIDKYDPDIVCCNHFKCYPNKKIPAVGINKRSGFYNRTQIEMDILPCLMQSKNGYQLGLSMWGKAVKRELMYKYQMLVDTNISIGEDIACMAPCFFYSDSLYITKEYLYDYRQNPDSMTKSGKVFDWNGPEIRGKHLEKVIDVNWGDMKDQLYRSTVHSLFNVVKSQFNSKDLSYKEIRKNITSNLNNDYYMSAINKSKFKGLKANSMRYLLKFRLIELIYLLNR